MGSGVHVVDLSPFFPTRDTQRTLRLSSHRAQVPSTACEQQQERALLVRSVQVVEDLAILATAFMVTVSGFVEGVSRVFFKRLLGLKGTAAKNTS